MAEVFHCLGCGGPIDDPSLPDILTARKRSRLPSFSDKETDPQTGYFHVVCFIGQRGYQLVDDDFV
ncbi:MAG TPA: hypothetical protein VHL54_01530 [Actinomycetota bacterium]|nr:hypothetical protein [Actinomycetota bacterium]